MNRSVSVVVVLVVCIAVLGVPTTMAGPDAAGSDSPRVQQSTTAPETEPQSQVQSPSSVDSIAQSEDFDQTTFEITVHENGSATWTFRHERRFDGDNESEERAAFEEFAEQFESEETGLYDRFTEQARAMTESGAEQTDREMEATNFRRSARVEESLARRGIVEMSFTWEGFARVDGGTVEVGDVFEDLFIAEDQALEIEAGDGLRFERIEPEDDARYGGNSLENANSVRWTGEQQFLDGQPRAVLVRDEVAEGNAVPWQLAAGALLVLAIGGGAVFYRRRWGDDGSGDGATPDVAARSDESAASEPSAGAAAATTTGGEAEPSGQEAKAEPGPEPLPDEELLTDEDRVVKLIRENGGRMKQVNIVEETGWSKSKVSMLLSDMEDEGTISKLRVGRENIISLDGFEPEATKSPFEE